MDNVYAGVFQAFLGAMRDTDKVRKVASLREIYRTCALQGQASGFRRLRNEVRLALRNEGE